MKTTKKIKKRRRIITLQSLASVMFFCSVLLYLCSSLFLQSYNNDLSMEIQKTEDVITVRESNNEALKVNIQSLSTRDRVMDIASDAGLESNQGNIVSIASGE